MNNARAKTGTLALLTVGVMSIVALGGLCAGVRTQIQFYRQALAGAQTDETVEIDKDSYRVLNGIVYAQNGAVLSGMGALRPLKLAYEVTLARRDPLFGLPGTDPAALTADASELQQAEQSLIARQITFADQAALQHLYPIDFIRSLADLEAKRQLLLSEPSEEHAQTYARTLPGVLANKEKDLAAFTDSVSERLNDNTPNAAVFSGVLNAKSELTSLRIFAHDLPAQARAVSARIRCYAGITTSCNESLQISLPTTLAATNAPRPISDAQAVNSIWRESYGDLYPGASGSTEGVLLERSACLPSVAGPLRLQLSENQALGGSYHILTYADDIFFIPTLAVKDFPFFKYERDQYQMSYTPMNPSKFYTCPQVGIDYGEAFAVVQTTLFAKQYPSIAPSERAQLIEEAGFPREIDADAYLTAALSTTSSADSNERHALEELALMSTLKTGDLDEVVKDIAHVTGLDSTNLSQAIDTSASTELLTHSAFLTFYRIGDPNPDAIASLYMQIPATTFSKVLTTYTALRNTVPQSVFVHDLHAFLVLERLIP